MECIWKTCHVPRANTITEDQTHEGFMCDALREFTFQDWDTKSLVLYGESGCGKTTWAKKNMPKPALFVSHMDTLKEFDPTFHKSIIFDDMSFSHYPRDSQIHMVDQYDPRAIHCRYAVANIPAKTPKVFTANERIFLQDAAIARRTAVKKINGIVI